MTNFTIFDITEGSKTLKTRLFTFENVSLARDIRLSLTKVNLKPDVRVHAFFHLGTCAACHGMTLSLSYEYNNKNNSYKTKHILNYY